MLTNKDEMINNILKINTKVDKIDLKMNNDSHI